MGKAREGVFITSVAACACAGKTIGDIFDSVTNGKIGVRQNSDYSDTPLCIGVLKDGQTFDTQLQNAFEALGVIENDKKTLLIVGSSVGGMLNTENILLGGGKPSDINPKEHAISSIKEKIEKFFAFDGSLSFSTACTSSANAITFGFELIKKGAYEQVVIAGADSISRTTVQGFHSLGVLSLEPCKPFDTDRSGMNVAEGVAFLLLKNRAVDDNSVEILGYGATSDAYNIAHPHSDGEGAATAMRLALQMGGVKAEDIDYINAHGTATQANDEAEAKAIEAIFKNTPYVGSTKSITGHTLGAAGALEAAIVCTAMRQSIIPKNTALKEAENKNINLPRENIQKKIRYALSNSFAFGGNNVSILFGIKQ